MKISKNQLKHIIREALAQEGVGSWLKDKFSKKRKPLPGEDTTPLDMSAAGGTVTLPDGETVELDDSPFKYKKRGPGVMSGPLGTAKWNRMQKERDEASVKAVGDVAMGEKPEGVIGGGTQQIAPLVPAGTGGLDQTEIQDLIDSGMGGALMRTAQAERGSGPKPEPGLKLNIGRGGRPEKVARRTTPTTTPKTPKTVSKDEDPNPWLTAPETASPSFVGYGDYTYTPAEDGGFTWSKGDKTGRIAAGSRAAKQVVSDRAKMARRSKSRATTVKENKIFDRWKELING